MKRRVQPEWLDALPPQDPRAAASRRDLRRLNAWMRHVPIVARALRSASPAGGPRRLVELGAGDGWFLLSVARKLKRPWEGTAAMLLDQQGIVAAQTLRAFRALGWRAASRQADVFDWLQAPRAASPAAAQAYDVILANLFLHHFSADQLVTLLAGVAARTRLFIAVEPRRSRWTLCFGRMVGGVGCNEITRHDAPVSIRAGFAARELSRLWPGGNRAWTLRERPAGLFSHLFIAQRLPPCKP